MDKYRVTLTAAERAALEHLVSVGKGAARKLTQARLLLLADTAAGAQPADDELVAALGVGLCTVGRVRRRLVTAGLPAALDHKPQPQRPDQIKIKGDIEPRLIQLAGSDPPEGRCQWTLQLLAEDLIVLGVVEAVSTETVRPALKKTTSTRGSSRRGASRPRPTPRTSGAWRTCFRPTCCRTLRSTRWCASMRRASNCSARSGRPGVLGRVARPRWITSTSGKESVTRC
jgi:Homeodomain-like domain